ncbi:hypothetical protein [Nostoc sp.]|uniref:hypothetical protein n=1 Tax=Nostoc sp. TaxID=1180 RepID=UPI002FFC92F3
MKMPYIVEVLEIVNSQGSGIGKWRLTTRVDGSKPQGLCTHRHDSEDEAWKCVEAWMMAKKLSGDSL